MNHGKYHQPVSSRRLSIAGPTRGSTRSGHRQRGRLTGARNVFLNLRKDRAEHINHSRCKLTGLEKGVLLTRSATDTNAASPAAQWVGHGAFIIAIVCVKPSFYFFILAGKAIANIDNTNKTRISIFHTDLQVQFLFFNEVVSDLRRVIFKRVAKASVI